MFRITREKHLDHMVRVVPFIVVCYAIQSYVILSADASSIARISLTLLGCILATMIGAFVMYDLKHQVEVHEDHLIISFLGKNQKILFKDIFDIQISHPGESFSQFSFRTYKGKFRFFFIDDAEKLKTWIDEHSVEEFQKAA